MAASGGASPPSPLFMTHDDDPSSPSSQVSDVNEVTSQQVAATQTQALLDGEADTEVDEVTQQTVVVTSPQAAGVVSVTVTGGDSLSSSPVSVSSSDSPTADQHPGNATQYIAVTVSTEQSGGVVVTGDTVAHPTYVQYVDDTSPEAAAATIYATTNGQMAYPVYTMGEATATMYTPAVSGQYYTSTTSQGAATYSQGQGQLLAQAGGAAAYILQSGVDPSEAHALITSNRASPPTVSAVQWLVENYETAEGVSLPRSTLYNHYLRHCNEHKLDPVNAASFGKLIRSVFLGLRTRRLGTRGNSKYHYYGIRVKPSSSLSHIEESSESMSPARQQGSNNGNGGSPPVKRFKTGQTKTEFETSHVGVQHSHTIAPAIVQLPQHHQYLGEGSTAIPLFSEIDFSGIQLPEDCTYEDVDTLRSIYREHCEAFLDAVTNLEFSTVESLWREFWRSSDNNNGDECEEEKYLSKTKLYLLCKCSPVQQFVRKVDFDFYQNLVEVLIPDVLRPIPSSLTQSIRNFAKGLEGWLTSAMTGCPEEIVNIKLCAVSAFAQTLRRYTSLNHLAQAARAVLQNSTQINQMLADLNRVDFHNVQEQASWVCQCDGDLVQRLEADFKATLQQQNSLEQWAQWLKNVVATVLKPFEGKPNFAKAARQFLLKWSFYSSMVIRDLTLRSAASFGSFHLIRLLYDEYMFYLIEHQVAVATGETPIAVIGEVYKSSNGSSEFNEELFEDKGNLSLVDFGSLQCNGGETSPTGSQNGTTIKLAPGTTIRADGTIKRLKMS